jgi:hypothetical protein
MQQPTKTGSLLQKQINVLAQAMLAANSTNETLKRDFKTAMQQYKLADSTNSTLLESCRIVLTCAKWLKLYKHTIGLDTLQQVPDYFPIIEDLQSIQDGRIDKQRVLDLLSLTVTFIDSIAPARKVWCEFAKAEMYCLFSNKNAPKEYMNSGLKVVSNAKNRSNKYYFLQDITTGDFIRPSRFVSPNLTQFIKRETAKQYDHSSR